MDFLRYFYHPDHLGSTSWITDRNGDAIQYLHYLPLKSFAFFPPWRSVKEINFLYAHCLRRFGEEWIDQRSTSWNAQYSFTGKIKDAETGYNYFGARYYDSGLSAWLSVDPLSDKYPTLSPYTYCANNPIMMVDPDGRFVYIFGDQLKAAMSSLQESTNLKLFNFCGFVIVTGGQILNENDQKLYNAIKSSSLFVRINASKYNTNNDGGGANMGTEKLSNGMIISMIDVNTDLLNAFESNSNAPRGSGMLHEVLEGYESANYTKETGEIIKPNLLREVFTPDVQLINGVETDVIVRTLEPTDPVNDARYTTVHNNSSYMPDYGSRYSRKNKKQWKQPTPGFTPKY